MSYLNQVQLIGNLGEAPEDLKTTKSGSFVRLRLATNKRYTNDKGEKLQDTQWHSVYLSNGVGKFALSNLSKGDNVFVTGELRTREWKDKAGKKQYSTAVYAIECQLLAKAQDKNAESDEATEQSAA